MISCADWNPDECPIECVYATNAEYCRCDPYDPYHTKSRLYGTDSCLLNLRKKSVDAIREAISKATDEALIKILKAANISPAYYRSHPGEFELKIRKDDRLSFPENMEQYELYYRNTLLGICVIRISVPELNVSADPKITIEAEVQYFPIEKIQFTKGD